MPKQIIFNTEAREYFKRGADVLSRVVKVTYGPRGHNVVLQEPYGAPSNTHDGAQVAGVMSVEEPFANMGVSLVKEASKKTYDDVGDGTTTSMILAQAMIREGFKNIAAGADTLALRQGLEKAIAAVVAELKKAAKPVTSKEQVTRIAAMSAHDQNIGEIIGDVLDKTGKDGVVTVEEGKGIKFETEFVEGMKFDHGYKSPYFVTDATAMKVVIEDPYILITDKKLSAMSELLPALEKVTQVSKNFVVIAEDIEQEALTMLVLNKVKGNLNCLAVQSPGYTDRRKPNLEDIATVTGGQAIMEEKGRHLDKIDISDLGRARRIIADKDNTTIVEGKGDARKIAERVKQIRAQMDNSPSDYDREKLQERLSRLAGGVAVIKVGAPTEVELKDRKSRVEGALVATRSATEEGVLPGGGVALVNAQSAIDKLALKDDEAVGANIVRKALEEPLKQLAVNAGYEGTVVLAKVKNGKRGFGFDIEKEEYGDMEEKGILDPLKVVRTALQNAASVAAMALITDSLVTDIPEKEKPAVMAPPPDL